MERSEGGEDFVLAIRARMAWLSRQVHLPAGLEHDLVPSSAGVSWVARLYAKTPLRDYWIMADVEENLPVREYPALARAGGTRPRGPSAKVCLYRHGVRTSAGFKWEHLLRLWPLMDQARTDWVRHPARPKARHDRDGHERIVAAGAPRFLGIGFGDAQARINKTCMFGARIQFPGDITLAQMSEELAALGALTLQLAQVASPCSQPTLPKHLRKADADSAQAHFRRSVPLRETTACWAWAHRCGRSGATGVIARPLPECCICTCGRLLVGRGVGYRAAPGIGRRSPRPSCQAGVTVVAGGDRFQVVAGRIVEVHAPPTVIGVDLAWPAHLGVGPVRDAPRADAFHDRVERGVANQECVVLAGEIDGRFGEVEYPAIGQVDCDEEPCFLRIGQAEDAGEEPCGLMLVPGGDDRVVETHIHLRMRHAGLLPPWAWTG